MALINKINEKSGIIAGVIGVALILFMLGGDIMSNNSVFNYGKDRVGKINGENISLTQYQTSVNTQEEEYVTQAEKPVGENEKQGLENQAWNELITRFTYKPEYEKLGLSVTDEELSDMVKGKFIHPQIVSAFGGEQSFDKNNVINFISNFDKVQPEIQAKWRLIEKKLPDIRLREKYVNLLKKTEYVTKEEAKRMYAEQNDKAEVNYVFVPYTTVNDSTVKVNDDQLEDYIKKNKGNYKVEEGRTIDYVLFNFTPSADDSLAMKKEAAEIAVNFKIAENDTAFIGGNSDAPAEPRYMSLNELPEQIRGNSSLVKDSVYGPYLSNGKYAIFKSIGTKNDTIASIRASHILFRIDGGKPEAEAKANEVLAKIKGGASFEEMAKEYGTDGTASKGGDLGEFNNNGSMVKPFEEACFKFKGKGLIPTLVETQFGYHIIKITEPKKIKEITQKYLVATVEKIIVAGDATKDILYTKATNFVAAVKDTQSYAAELKKDPSLQHYTFPNAGKNERNVTGLRNAREIVRWAYNDAKVGGVSTVFTMEDQYVVAILVSTREEGTASVNDVRNDVTAKVKNELKAVQIIEKLSKLTGDYNKIAADYGPQALTGIAPGVTFASSAIGTIGYDPVACGKVFGLKPTKKTAPFKGETGVVMLELLKIQAAPEVADYNQQKTQKESQRAGADDYQIDEALKKIADIQDNRYKFY
ncbi:MAG TPA: peptidylprolyl isomerase [Cytophagaceae bacterium]|jgi:peptidyl-prolyl cis-trans isomerase D|nr:peptidylprolyl isomerase [Cytophagaceae bacterium]